jgi:HEAT repeat protein
MPLERPPARAAILAAVLGAVTAVLAVGVGLRTTTRELPALEEPLPPTVGGRPLKSLVDEALESRDLDVARANGKELSLSGASPGELVPRLRDEVRTAPARRATAAAILIGRLGTGASEAVPDLAGRLGDSDPALRQECALALGYMGPRAASAVSALLPLLADPAQPIRLATVSALGEIGPAAGAALGALQELSRSDPDLLVRTFAAAAARRIGPEAPPPAPGSRI